MKILYLSMSYRKNGDGLYNNLVDELISRGHKVVIVRCDSDNSDFETINDKYKILNVKTGNPFESNLIKKGINQLLLSRYFNTAIKEKLFDETFDLILYATPPITLYRVIKYCKKQYHAKTYLMLKDIFPQNAVDLEMFSKNSFVYKYFRRQEKLYYKISDNIGCMSQGNIDYLLRHNPEINSHKVHVFYNAIRVENCETIFNKDYTNFIFGGNLGKPQNISFLLEIVKELQNYDKAFFTFVGKGTEKNKIIEFIKENNLSNIIYNEYMPAKEFEEILKHADVGLISLDYRFTIPNIPSKFQAYLRQRKPVLAITDPVTDIKDMILKNNCGWWIEAKDKQKIVNLIKNICENKEDQIIKGENGFNYFLKEFDVRLNVDKIERIMSNKN